MTGRFTLSFYPILSSCHTNYASNMGQLVEQCHLLCRILLDHPAQWGRLHSSCWGWIWCTRIGRCPRLLRLAHWAPCLSASALRPLSSMIWNGPPHLWHSGWQFNNISFVNIIEVNMSYTEIHLKACTTWFGELSSCSCLTALPGFSLAKYTSLLVHHCTLGVPRCAPVCQNIAWKVLE